MLYATIDKQRWDSLPAEWDKVQDMFKYLNRMVWGYQLTMERRMIMSPTHPEFQCTLIRWENGTKSNDPKKREVLLETSDHTQMEAALFMLINEFEPAYKEAMNGKQVSMIP